MSKESLTALNTLTLIGHTDQRGTAWHYRAEDQGAEPNHYPGPIPPRDVSRRLFNWSAESHPIGVELPATVATMTHLDGHGKPVRWAKVQGKQAIVRSDTSHVMGIFSTGYVPHQYEEWLLNSVANLLDDNLSISSAGLLRGGAIAWVEVGVPETLTTPEGFDYRLNLLATTSFDGSIATTYKRTITATVCDNTRDLALSEPGQQVKVKHSRHSSLKIADARAALAMVHQVSDAFRAEVAELCQTDLTSRQWQRFLDLVVPLNDPNGKPLAGRALTMASRRREGIDAMYQHDHRVSPWTGTAFGALQAVNTYEHHGNIVRGARRADRNMLRSVSGDFSKLDAKAWSQLERVLTAN